MKNKFSIEEALTQLERNSELLKSGELTIDESVKIYEESVKLYKDTSKQLNDIKQKIEIYDPEKQTLEEFDDIQ